MNICIFGASSRGFDREYYEAAAELGALIAEHGHTLVFGGSDVGIMGAAAHGAYEYGGRIIGVMPRESGVQGAAYPGCTELIYTDSLAERKRIMQDSSDGFIMLPGGLGTFDELFDTLALRQLGKHSKPIALLNTMDFYCALELTLVNLAKKGFMDQSCLDMFALCQYPEDALDYVLRTANIGGTITCLNDYSK